MLRLRFRINDIFLLYYALSHPELLKSKRWDQEIKKIRQSSPHGYDAIAKNLDWSWRSALAEANSPKDSSIWLNKVTKESEAIFKHGLGAPEFKKIREETQVHLQEVQMEWDKESSKALKILEDIIRMPLPSKTIEVLMVHPKLRGGFHLAGHNPKIVWGHKEEWPKYHIVYLCHELLHILFNPDNDINQEILHALIELATDNELRIRLHGKGRYFYVGKKYIGHDYLKPFVKNIFPAWERYLSNKKINLKELAKKLTTKK